MKYFYFILSLCFIQTITNAQWSNTTNLFTDDAQLPVVSASGAQQPSLSVISNPDNGYIIFWEDERKVSTNKKDIYAQKYDKDGNALWGANGVPVAAGLNNEHFISPMNTDYRNYSYACSDNAGGVYICFIDDSIATYDWQRICVQHLRSDGTKAFSKSYIIAQTPSGQTFNFLLPQLVADGNGGFFISYIIDYTSTQEVNVYCYKDVNGTLKYYGGGVVNRNYTTTTDCPQQLISRGATVSDYMLYPSLQSGCNVAMSMSDNSDPNYPTFNAYNKLVRVKKNVNVTDDHGGTIKYKKDSVMVFYTTIWHTVTVTCPGGGIGTAYLLDGNGFQYTGNAGANTYFSKGVELSTDGNINVDVNGATLRQYTGNNTLSNYYTQVTFRKSEKYSDVPYEFKTSPFRPVSFTEYNKPPYLDDLNNTVKDTILNNSSVYPYEFSMKQGGNKIYIAANMYNGPFVRDVYLQQLQLNKKATGSYAVEYTTTKQAGTKIGNEVSTGFGGSDIFYDNPQLATDSSGNAVFYINESGRSPRVSPIINKTQLAWGAMGRRIGSGATANGYYSPVSPFIIYSTAIAGTGFTSLTEQRVGGTQGINIYDRHLDYLTRLNYQPAYKTVKKLANGNPQAYPEIMIGSTKAFSLVEILNYNAGVFSDASPCIAILDNFNLGTIAANVFQNGTATIRRYNNKPYLDRNVTVKPQNLISANASVTMRIFFSTDEFTALKTAYPALTDPSSLAVIKQPYTTGNAPSEYAPITGEVKIPVSTWAAVRSGYYIEFSTTKFAGYNNYYIFPAANTPLKAVDNSSLIADDKKIFIQKIYPTIINNNSLFIQTGNENIKEMLVEIFNADGKAIYQQKCLYQSQSIKLPVVTNGTYNVRISAGDLSFKTSLIKQ